MKINITVTHGAIYRVRKYADPVMLALGYDLNKIMPGVKDPSNFGYANLNQPGIGTLTVSNFVTLSDADIAYHRSLQTTNGGRSVDQIMAWFYGGTGRPYGTQAGVSGARWYPVLYAGQLVKIDKIETRLVKVPNSGDTRLMQMGRVVPFTRADMGKPLSELLAAGKVQQATAVRGTDNQHVETPNGAVMYSPLWSAEVWDLKPKAEGAALEYWAFMETLE